MNIYQATFIRIDTANGNVYLDQAHGDVVASTVIAGHDKGLYELLGFCVLPSELQILFIPKGKTTTDILRHFEDSLAPAFHDIKPVFDADIYREKIDSNEEIRNRIRWMHGAPVRARLVSVSNLYPYSSANARYQENLRAMKELL
jgi:hypothetical protein